MRITSGQDRGRTIITPKGDVTRPTTDKVRQALFNRLRSAISGEFWEDLTVLDAFAGSGALGLEALSNKVGKVIFCEKDKKAQAVIKKNIETLSYKQRAQLIPKDCFKVTKDQFQTNHIDLIFLDPPYGFDLANAFMHHLFDLELVDKETIFYVEMSEQKKEPIDEGKFDCFSNKQYGSIISNLYRLR